MPRVRVAFVCVHNSCRSQMAEFLARHIAPDALDPSSRGTAPSGEVDPMAVQVMAEIGVPMPGARPKLATEEMLRSSDLIVHMGCGSESACPFVPGVPSENWGIDDPKGEGIESYRVARDIIESKVRELANRIRAGARVSEGMELKFEGV